MNTAALMAASGLWQVNIFSVFTTSIFIIIRKQVVIIVCIYFTVEVTEAQSNSATCAGPTPDTGRARVGSPARLTVLLGTAGGQEWSSEELFSTCRVRKVHPDVRG